MVTVPDSSAEQSQNPSKVSADTPAGIADLTGRLPLYLLSTAQWRRHRTYVRTLLYPISMSLRF